MKLKAPEEYWLLTETERKEMLNQCGPNGPLNHLIPNHLLGLNISESCDIHDFMYIKSLSGKDLKKADRIFFDNMMTQVKNGSSSVSIWRKILAYINFGAVRIYSWIQK